MFEEKEDTNLDDVEAVFKDSEVSLRRAFIFELAKKKIK